MCPKMGQFLPDRKFGNIGPEPCRLPEIYEVEVTSWAITIFVSRARRKGVLAGCQNWREKKVRRVSVKNVVCTYVLLGEKLLSVYRL